MASRVEAKEADGLRPTLSPESPKAILSRDGSRGGARPNAPTGKWRRGSAF